MITIPLSNIKKSIKEQSNISEEEINQKIQKKLSDLSGLISEEGAAHIIANELGVKLIPEGEKLQVKNILTGMRNVEVTGKVTRKYELKEFQTEKRSGKLASFVMADETGFIRVVLWNDQTDEFKNINEGDVISIKGGYVKENNGRKEIHLGDSGKISINPEGITVKEIKDTVKRKKLSELAEGDENIEILGTIVQVFDIRFFEIDAKTGRRVKEREGKYYLGEEEVENISYAYVMNIFLDDGTDNVRTVLWRNQIQKLLDKTNEEILEFKDNPAEFEPIKTDLLGTIVKVVGRTNKNEAFDRIELIANLIYKDVDPEEEIRKIKQQETKKEETKTTPTETITKNKNSEEIVEETNTTEEPTINEEKNNSTTEDTNDYNDELEEETISIEDLEDIDR
ncbi:MAG: hypothetical protein KKF89_05290 [Nanoarchaeota archaeon]|nr:hypothetical protein [Nanoarchaeota archaeon]MBU1855109.1 hypothetical protein [Nanoarchaeota archaeon]